MPVINIGSKLDAKGFKQAETSMSKLGKSGKNLARNLGFAFSTAAVLSFAKASIKASLEAQAQQERLVSLVKTTVGATDQQIRALNDQADALAQIGVVTGGNITQTQSQLATFNLQIDTIKTLTPAILDYVTAEKGAAASTADFKSMTNGLAQALNGNFASLTKVGFVLDDATKKTIASGTETERAAALVAVLDSTYKNFNKNLRNTPQGQFQVLTESARQAQEVIGGGLLDAIKILSGDNGLGSTTNAIKEMSEALSESIVTTAKLIAELKKIPLIGDFFKSFSNPLNLPKEFLVFGKGGLLDEFRKYGKIFNELNGADMSPSTSNMETFLKLSKIRSLSQMKSDKAAQEAAKKLAKIEKDKAVAAAKTLAAKKLSLATDKAQLALGKGESVFNIDAIQNNAALINQAEQLGKVTSAAQVLAIANDVARLNIKKSMLDLEAAIASGDVKAIESATAKLNADLKILGALTGQAVKMQDIKSILESLKSRDLINLDNLDTAIAKMLELIKLQGQTATTVPTKTSTGVAASGIPVGNFIAPISTTGASIDAILEYADAAAARANAFADLLDMQNVADNLALTNYLNKLAPSSSTTTIPSMGSIPIATAADIQSGNRYAAQAAATYNITIQANTVASPDELTNLIQDAVIRLNKRGDYITTAGAL